MRDRTLLLAAGLAMVLFVAAPGGIAHADAEAAHVSVLNRSMLPAPVVLDALAAAVPAGHLALLKDPKYLLYVESLAATDEGGMLACVAIMGITTPSGSRSLLPRLPARLFSAIAKMTGPGTSVRDRTSCIRNALSLVFTDWGQLPAAQMLDAPDLSLSQGTPTPPLASGEAMHMLFRGQLSTEGRADIMAAVPATFRAAFDERTYTWLLVANVTADAPMSCYALAGVSAPAPAGRLPRIPAVVTGIIVEAAKPIPDRASGEQECMQLAAIGAISAHLRLPWDTDGIFRRFDLTSDEGHTAPRLRAGLCDVSLRGCSR